VRVVFTELAGNDLEARDYAQILFDNDDSD